MKKFTAIVVLSILMLFSCQKNETKKLHIAVAANMQFAMEELIDQFTNETGVECETIISSSGKLTAQIKEHAAYDVFVAADMKYPTELFNSGFAIQKPEIYAYGKLVLLSMIDSLKPSFEMLPDENVKHIAIANPRMAPYGEAAVEALKHFKLFDSVKDKLVYGESISQANQFIISKAAEVGFTAKSVVLSPEMKGKGNWIDVDAAHYSPIAQGAIIIKHDDVENKEAESFYKFLFSPKAKTILENYGYAFK